MQRVDRAAVDGPSGRDERLAGDLTAEDPLAVLLRAPAAEDVHLELLEVEDREQLGERVGHDRRASGVGRALSTIAAGRRLPPARAAHDAWRRARSALRIEATSVEESTGLAR